MRAEHRPLRCLEELAPGTRVRLAPGRLRTLLEVNFTRAIVELDYGEDRRREIAPGCEVEVFAADELAMGRETALPAPGMRNTDQARPASPDPPCDTSKGPPLQAGRTACATCAGLTDPRRPWGRYCSGACRRWAYRQRRNTTQPSTTATAETP